MFIASAYSHPLPSVREMNVRRSLEAAVHLIHKGHEPFAPLLSHYTDLVATSMGQPVCYERWLQWTMSYLRACDAILVLGSSPGADRELIRAMELGLTVYERVEDVPEADDGE